MSDVLLAVRDLAIEINGRELVSNVDFQLGRSGCIGIVGETGSGKSLTCRAITGMLPWLDGHILRGKIVFDGLDVAALSERELQKIRGHRIGFVPQNSLTGLDPVMKVGNQLRETMHHLQGRRPRPHEVVELLERVRMPRAASIYHAYPHELSGGMRQRVMIALGIAGDPELLVADEATTALDVTVQRDILGLMSVLRQETGMAMILVSHDLDVVAAMSDQIAIMYAGAIVELGETANVLNESQHPYTRALLESRPGAVGPGEALRAIPGHPPDPRDWTAGCRFAPRCPLALPSCENGLPELVEWRPRRLVRCIRAGEGAYSITGEGLG